MELSLNPVVDTIHLEKLLIQGVSPEAIFMVLPSFMGVRCQRTNERIIPVANNKTGHALCIFPHSRQLAICVQAYIGIWDIIDVQGKMFVYPIRRIEELFEKAQDEIDENDEYCPCDSCRAARISRRLRAP